MVPHDWAPLLATGLGLLVAQAAHKLQHKLSRAPLRAFECAVEHQRGVAADVHVGARWVGAVVRDRPLVCAPRASAICAAPLYDACATAAPTALSHQPAANAGVRACARVSLPYAPDAPRPQAHVAPSEKTGRGPPGAGPLTTQSSQEPRISVLPSGLKYPMRASAMATRVPSAAATMAGMR